jgi:hypothetical protein
MTTEELIESWKAKAAKCKLKAQYAAADAYESCANDLAMMDPHVTSAQETHVISTVTHRRSFRYAAIVKVLGESTAPMRVCEIANAINVKQINAYPYIRRMVEDGTAERVSAGRYQLSQTKVYA